MGIVSCQIHGLVFTRFTFLSEKPPDGYTWSGERLTRKQTTSRPDKLCPEIWKHMSDAPNVKTNQSVLSRNQSSIMPENHVVFTSLFLKTRNLRNSWRMLVDSYKNPMPAAMPCKTLLCQSSRETCSSIGGHKTKYAFIIEADESMRIRLEGAPDRYHEDHIAGKGLNSLGHYNPSAQIYSCASSNENTRCKGSTGKKRKTRENPGMAAKVRNKNEVIAEARNVCRNSAFCVINGSLSS